MTVWRSRKISGCSRWGLSAKDKEASKQMVLHNFTTADLNINQVVSNDPLGPFPQTCENYNCEYQPLKMQAMLSYV